MDVSVIVPTYREAANLPVLVAAVHDALTTAKTRYELIAVDDDSRDGTEQIFAELAARHPLRLIVRRGGRGLPSAVVRGMREATGRWLVVMDADLSHPPESIPALLEALRDGADFALG